MLMSAWLKEESGVLTHSAPSLKNMILYLVRGEDEFPVLLNQDLIIFTGCRNKTGINKRSKLQLLKTKRTDTGRAAET